nr:probable WRKY transcription factor 49 [Tanacetum cinerariifolium]
MLLTYEGFTQTLVNENYMTLMGLSLYWKVLRKQVIHYVRECLVCEKYKPDLAAYPGPLPIPKNVCTNVSMDFIEGLRKSQGKNVIFVVVDSKFSSSDMERGVSNGRVENNKYILKMKSSSNIIADDGYKWRKYGQKSIKNSSNPRSYYKCTNPHCGAKKQVERSNDDPDTLIITYEGLHLHYMAHQRPNKDTDVSIRHVCPDQQPSTMSIKDINPPEVAINSQGLLEDMVPLIIRNPVTYTTNSCKSSSSYSSSPLSHPSPPASPLFSWTPIY